MPGHKDWLRIAQRNLRSANGLFIFDDIKIDKPLTGASIDRFSIDQAEVTAALEKAAKVLTLTKKIIEDRQAPNTRLF
jgi:hypothetical protein